MGTDYNEGRVAEQFQESRKQPWRSVIEEYSFLKLIGDVSGKEVLDVACGRGHYSRILAQAGASRVVGIDISDRMIALAREQEALEPLGIEYRVEDARSTAAQPDFDLVVAAYLLGYAPDRTELARMCRGLASRIKPGSRFVTITTNWDLYSFPSLPDYRKYGFEVNLADRVFEGAPLEFIFNVGDSALALNAYHLSADAYESELSAAGFGDFKVCLPELDSSTGVNNGGFWDDFLNYPPHVYIDCVKT